MCKALQPLVKLIKLNTLAFYAKPFHFLFMGALIICVLSQLLALRAVCINVFLLFLRKFQSFL